MTTHSAAHAQISAITGGRGKENIAGRMNPNSRTAAA